MSLRRLAALVAGINMVLLACVVVLVVMLFNAAHLLDRASAAREGSMLLASELAYSSINLTRYARTYVETGEQRYLAMYDAVRAIRDGALPTPAGYNAAYWDIKQADPSYGVAGEAPGRPLVVRMREQGYAEPELALLREAEQISNRLVATEQDAMHAVRGLYRDRQGAFTRRGAPDRDDARRLLYDETYQRNKAEIMRPIAQATALMEARTGELVAQSRRRQQVCLGLTGMAIALLVLSAANSYRLLMRRAILPVLSMAGQAMVAGRDPGAAIDVREGGEVGQLAATFNLVLRRMHAARVEADAANHAKSRFLANMSHEIRTPLNAVLGLSQLAMHSCADARQRDYLAKIVQAGTALRALTDDVLDLSRIEAGAVQLECAAFSPAALLREVQHLCAVAAQAKGIALRADVAPDMPATVAGDAARLRQVLLNLAANAVKFTEQGSVRVTVAASGTAAGVALAFCVTDTGIGMDGAQLARLFEPYSQADAGAARRHGGAGLGLSISRQLVHLMGGEITVASTPGEGSEFRVTVPCAVPDDDALAPAPEDMDTVLADVAPRLRGARVLLAEDHPLNAQVVRELLALAGVDVDLATDGRQAVEMTVRQHGRYAALLMDLQMPGMDGLAAVQEIRAVLGRDHPPIIALTAHAMLSERAQCMAAGMAGHIAKPIAAAQLYRVLAACLR